MVIQTTGINCPQCRTELQVPEGLRCFDFPARGMECPAYQHTAFLPIGELPEGIRRFPEFPQSLACGRGLLPIELTSQHLCVVTTPLMPGVVGILRLFFPEHQILVRAAHLPAFISVLDGLYDSDGFNGQRPEVCHTYWMNLAACLRMARSLRTCREGFAGHCQRAKQHSLPIMMITECSGGSLSSRSRPAT